MSGGWFLGIGSVPVLVYSPLKADVKDIKRVFRDGGYHVFGL